MECICYFSDPWFNWTGSTDERPQRPDSRPERPLHPGLSAAPLHHWDTPAEHHRYHYTLRMILMLVPQLPLFTHMLLISSPSVPAMLESETIPGLSGSAVKLGASRKRAGSDPRTAAGVCSPPWRRCWGSWEPFTLPWPIRLCLHRWWNRPFTSSTTSSLLPLWTACCCGRTSAAGIGACKYGITVFLHCFGSFHETEMTFSEL